MKRVFLDKEGDPEVEGFRAATFKQVDTGKTRTVDAIEAKEAVYSEPNDDGIRTLLEPAVEGHEGRQEPIYEMVEIPYVETRPYVEMGDDFDPKAYLVKNGKLVKKTKKDLSLKLYNDELELVYQKRIAEYGPLAKQLDEMYHDYDGWRDRIASVKAKHPKPEKVK